MAPARMVSPLVVALAAALGRSAALHPSAVQGSTLKGCCVCPEKPHLRRRFSLAFYHITCDDTKCPFDFEHDRCDKEGLVDSLLGDYRNRCVKDTAIFDKLFRKKGHSNIQFMAAEVKGDGGVRDQLEVSKLKDLLNDKGVSDQGSVNTFKALSNRDNFTAFGDRQMRKHFAGLDAIKGYQIMQFARTAPPSDWSSNSVLEKWCEGQGKCDNQIEKVCIHFKTMKDLPFTMKGALAEAKTFLKRRKTHNIYAEVNEELVKFAGACRQYIEAEKGAIEAKEHLIPKLAESKAEYAAKYAENDYDEAELGRVLDDIKEAIEKDKDSINVVLYAIEEDKDRIHGDFGRCFWDDDAALDFKEVRGKYYHCRGPQTTTVREKCSEKTTSERLNEILDDMDAELEKAEAAGTGMCKEEELYLPWRKAQRAWKAVPEKLKERGEYLAFRKKFKPRLGKFREGFAQQVETICVKKGLAERDAEDFYPSSCQWDIIRHLVWEICCKSSDDETKLPCRESLMDLLQRLTPATLTVIIDKTKDNRISWTLEEIERVDQLYAAVEQLSHYVIWYVDKLSKYKRQLYEERRSELVGEIIQLTAAGGKGISKELISYLSRLPRQCLKKYFVSDLVQCYVGPSAGECTADKDGTIAIIFEEASKYEDGGDDEFQNASDVAYTDGCENLEVEVD